MAFYAAFFTLLLSALIAASARAQPQPTPLPEATPSAAREDPQLNDARRVNEEAQAEYYRTQTEKLRQPEPPKTLWRALSDNAAILGALTAALVALFTLVVNQRTALRARKDTEFYEALKRFGDKDSPTVRASAAAMLMEMSDTTFFAWRWRKHPPWWRPDQKMIRYPYSDTALDQLITGLLIEENSVVVHSIVGALKQMMRRSFRRSADSLREANLKLQQDMATRLREFFTLIKGVGAIDGDHIAAEKAWGDIESLTGCSREGLLAIVSGSLYETSGIVDHPSRVMDVGKKPARLSKVLQDKLVDAGNRLRQNVALCEILLRERSKQPNEPLNFSFAYLANVNLMSLNLRDIDFRRALMHGAYLFDAKLTDAKLHGARIDERAVLFDRANWWRADFTEPEGPGSEAFVEQGSMEIVSAGQPPVDQRLIETLLLRYGELSPEMFNEAHPSVKKYLAWRKKSNQQVGTKREIESPSATY